METNVEIAVRINPVFCTSEDVLCVKPNICSNTIELGNTQSYPVNYALPNDCTQSSLFVTTVTPLINYLFEGCDVSVLTFGQSGSGKSYTILGPGLNCALSESEYGIIPRFLREVFATVCQNSDRNYLIHVTWTQICGENVQDLLGTGSVECSSVSDAFELLQLGISNIVPQCAHTLFTITLEQQWVIGATVQHRISTASFIDLQNSKKILLTDSNGLVQSVPTDTGLLTLQQCIWALSEPSIALYNSNNVIPYNQSALTMLLKDSFGGRAKTLLICCISPIISDFMETFYTLQFAMRAQMVKNYVTINSYTTFEMAYETMDLFALQFATNQLFKLVSNAECLFKNLIFNSSLSKNQMEQISQWLTLKQECKDCISESSEPRRSLERIEEEIEDNCDILSEESEIPCEDDQTNFEDLMQNFSIRTDNLVSTANKRYNSITTTKESNNSSSNSEYHLKGARGRRVSIHSAEEFIPLCMNKTEEGTSPDQNQDIKVNIKKAGLSFEVKQKVLKQICSEIESCEHQISELEVTIRMKEKLVQHLLKHKNTKINVRDKLKQKYQKLQNDQYVAHSKLLQAKSEKNNDIEQKYHLEISQIAQKLNDAELIKAITEDDSRKIVELENSLCNSKKQLEKLKRYKQKEEKRKISLENDIKRDQKYARPACDFLKSEENKYKNNSIIKSDAQVSYPHNYLINKFITEVDQINANEDVGNLKHKIKELRKTRDFLLEQIYGMDTQSHNRRLLNEFEERKLLQCEEAIEAVDIAIEYKNQMICNCVSETNLEQEDKVARMLMEQIMKLNENEIRVLLKKYFEKVIDLRSTTKKIEQQMLEVESQNENLLVRIQSFNHTLQRVRSETEHRILTLQQQHESKLQLMMRYLANSENSDGECVTSRVVERSKQAALAFKVSQGLDKQVDKGSFIARFTSRYARHETVPRQLQAAITPPQAKVTRQKNKLIIQQSSK